MFPSPEELSFSPTRVLISFILVVTILILNLVSTAIPPDSICKLNMYMYIYIYIYIYMYVYTLYMILYYDIVILYIDNPQLRELHKCGIARRQTYILLCVIV